MNRGKCLGAIVMLACSLSAEAITQSATLSDVVVFRTGAELHHVADVAVEKGDNTIVLEGLSPVADVNTFRITLSNGVNLVAHEYSIDNLSIEKTSLAFRLMNDSLTTLEERYEVLQNEIATVQQMLTLLNEGVGQTMSAERQVITGTLIDTNLDYYAQRSKSLYAQKSMAEKEQTLLKKSIAELQQRIAQANAYNVGKTGVLSLHLNAPQACKAEVKVCYFTHAASWQPTYEVTVASQEDPLVLHSKALLTQTTGVDWENVHLTLSTALPHQGLSAPEPTKWLLRQQMQVRPKAAVLYRTNMMTTDAVETVFEMEDAAAGASSADNTDRDGRVFDVTTPYTVFSNGKPQVIALGMQSVENVSYGWYTLPQMDNTVYLTAQLLDVPSGMLLDGNVSVSYRGTYYGEQYMRFSAADKKISLTLGEEPLIAVKRERINEYSQTKQLANETKITVLYKITVKNNLTTAATVTLKETYPISATKGIDVSISDKTTRWTECDTDNGVLTYDLTLQPGEIKEIQVGYTIKYPKDWNINFH